MAFLSDRAQQTKGSGAPSNTQLTPRTSCCQELPIHTHSIQLLKKLNPLRATCYKDSTLEEISEHKTGSCESILGKYHIMLALLLHLSPAEDMILE